MATPSVPTVAVTSPSTCSFSTESVAERERRLARLREPGPIPAPILLARPAAPEELPSAAAGLIKACRAPWSAWATYAIGPSPYTWERKAAGYMLAASVLVQVRHRDGRAASVLWVLDGIAERVGAKLPKGVQGPRRPPDHVLAWQVESGRRWTINPRTGRPAFTPIPIGPLDLRRAIADDLAALDAPAVPELVLDDLERAA